jgi:hypothetical protein
MCVDRRQPSTRAPTPVRGHKAPYTATQTQTYPRIEETLTDLGEVSASWCNMDSNQKVCSDRRNKADISLKNLNLWSLIHAYYILIYLLLINSQQSHILLNG